MTSSSQIDQSRESDNSSRVAGQNGLPDVMNEDDREDHDTGAAAHPTEANRPLGPDNRLPVSPKELPAWDNPRFPSHMKIA